MHTKPLISVIIPFFNRIDWLEEALDSVLSQTYQNYEIILVNDGSKEDLSNLLDKYGMKINYVYQQNAGPATARNKGIEIAKGEYIAFLDSDDLWEKEKLEKQLKYMLVNDYIWSHTSYSTFDKSNSFISVSKFKGNVFPEILYSAKIATPCVMIKSKILKENVQFRFNTNMRYGQDSYLWVLLSNEFELGALEEPLSSVRIRGTNAALRAVVQIKAKSNINSLLIRTNLVDERKITKSAKIAYNLTDFTEKILKILERKRKTGTIIEGIAKILYLVPWLIFKLNSSLSKKNMLKRG